MRHSRGPWIWTKHHSYNQAKLESPDGTVCHFGDAITYYPTEGDEPNGADKALIAAAPDLLRQLEVLMTVIKEANLTEVLGLMPAMCAARDAVKKARGEA